MDDGLKLSGEAGFLIFGSVNILAFFHESGKHFMLMQWLAMMLKALQNFSDSFLIAMLGIVSAPADFFYLSCLIMFCISVLFVNSWFALLACGG